MYIHVAMWCNLSLWPLTHAWSAHSFLYISLWWSRSSITGQVYFGCVAPIYLYLYLYACSVRIHVPVSWDVEKCLPVVVHVHVNVHVRLCIYVFLVFLFLCFFLYMYCFICIYMYMYMIVDCERIYFTVTKYVHVHVINHPPFTCTYMYP